MESLIGALATGGAWAGLVVWLALSFAATLVIFAGLPGGWIALGLTLLYDLFHGFGAIGWPWHLGFAALLGLAEGVEFLLGTLYVAKRGASRAGTVGCMVGGFAGAMAGSALLPGAGTVAGGIVGAFGGVILGEYLRDRSRPPDLRLGFHATLGRILAITVKFVLSLAGLAAVGWVAVASLTGKGSP